MFALTAFAAINASASEFDLRRNMKLLQMTLQPGEAQSLVRAIPRADENDFQPNCALNSD
jgi:hypothetical protein